MKVGTLPITRACSVPKTSPPITGYQRGVQLVKIGGRGGVHSQKWSHLTRKMREFEDEG